MIASGQIVDAQNNIWWMSNQFIVDTWLENSKLCGKNKV